MLGGGDERMASRMREGRSVHTPTGETLWTDTNAAQNWAKGFTGSLLGRYLAKTERESVEIALSQHSAPRFKRVIDVGCGNGRYFSLFPGTDLAVGVDISLEMLKLAKQENAGVHLVVADIGNLPFRSSSFDCVLCTRTLQHIVDQRAAVAELARQLSQDGMLVLLCYNAWTLHCLYKEIRQSAFIRALDRLFRVSEKNIRLLKPVLGVWQFNYDNYMHILEIRQILDALDLSVRAETGATFGELWFLQYFLVGPLLEKFAPTVVKSYLSLCYRLESRLRCLFPFKHLLDKIVVSAVRV